MAFMPHPSTRIPLRSPSHLKFVRMHKPFDEDKRYQVFYHNTHIGDIYKEYEMTEWACDASLEERIGMNVGAGYTRLADLQKELRTLATDGLIRSKRQS